MRTRGLGGACCTLLLLLLYWPTSGDALECYVCTNQEENTGKCQQALKTCEYGEDTCMSSIRWGSTPYWSQGALKQYYVSKQCATREECRTRRTRDMRFCTHIWYEDWACSECCQGDRCNYFVISGTPFSEPAPAVAIAGLAALLAGHLLRLS